MRPLAIVLLSLLAACATPPPPSAAADLTEGEVLQLDRQRGTVTLKHGDMPKLRMSAMIMTFEVRNKAELEGLQVGDKVRFDADGSFTVTRIEKAR